ncbi:MAG: DHHA1 domain-containing protein [Methanoculleaceae archaeon]
MGLVAAAKRAADTICAADSITLVSHIDADGITSEGIISTALVREGIPVETVFVRQLEPLSIRRIPRDAPLTVFTDLGAGQQNLLEENGFSAENVLIVDHHVPEPCNIDYPIINSLDYGYRRLSAAGICYLIAREIDRENHDLAQYAVIGNVGDMMARETRGLVGPARDIALEGERAGVVEIRSHDLNAYGSSTRPLHICLAYCNDPWIPGISNEQQRAAALVRNLGIPLKTPDGRWRVWEELDMDEKRTIAAALVEQTIAHGEDPERLFAETYLFPEEMPRSPLRNASEFATVLNACGRWARPAVGSSLCRGDRGTAYREAEYMLRHHRSIIRELLMYILETGVVEREFLQYIHVGTRFPDTIIGIGAGMALSRLDRTRPIMIMAELPDDPEVTKVSMRTVERVVSRGIDLQQAMVVASEEVGGAGGGHPIAAGAYIPRSAEEEFIEHVERVLAEQLDRAGPDDR